MKQKIKLLKKKYKKPVSKKININLRNYHTPDIESLLLAADEV